MKHTLVVLALLAACGAQETPVETAELRIDGMTCDTVCTLEDEGLPSSLVEAVAGRYKATLKK